jgi:hypothetical protein
MYRCFQALTNAATSDDDGRHPVDGLLWMMTTVARSGAASDVPDNLRQPLETGKMLNFNDELFSGPLRGINGNLIELF